MLVTFEEPPYAIKAGWKENHATFMNELKNLQAEGLTTLGQSLRTAFDLLNLNRLVTGIDNYGQKCKMPKDMQWCTQGIILHPRTSVRKALLP